MLRWLIVLILSITLISCNDDIIVKPNALLRLEYPKGTYQRANTQCAYSFLKNENAKMVKTNRCGLNIHYPRMNATIYLTYQKVNENIEALLYDAQKLAYDHDIKAESIPEQPFVNPDKDVYGMFYMINGDAASQSHFYVTDSLSHFVTGSLYFKAKPNFDSIYPAVIYLREDIRRIMETFEWE